MKLCQRPFSDLINEDDVTDVEGRKRSTFFVYYIKKV